jgi:SIR2-like domain
MTVQTIDKDQIRSLQEHIDKATALEPARVAEIRALVAQLLEQDLPVLPIVGAGASHDCGMRLASALGKDLYWDYMNNPDYASEPRDAVKEDLADVAQAIHNAADQIAVVKAIGLDDPALWPDAENVPEHFCLYRVLSRLAREDLFEEVIGFNYDCAKEAGLKREGFQLSQKTIAGRKWSDHATVIADKQTMYKPPRKGALTYHKAHGCAHRFRELALVDEAKAAETIIICSEQLTNWRDDLWMAERLRDRARESLLVLIGFSAQDAVVHGELKKVLDEIYKELPPEGKPRLVTIDAKPEAPVLRGLIKSGLGGEMPPSGVVTEINVSTSSTTAVALVLLTEYLRLALASHLEGGDYALPDGLDEQIAALAIAAPLMLRWTYLLRAPSQDQYVQKINMEQAAHGGYVPLTVDPRAAALALETRVKLREALSIAGPESARETLTDHGFITRAGFAYLPVALTLEELLAACRPGGTIERARVTLGVPSKIERILVTLQDDVLRGVNADTGAEVVLPA